MEVSRKRRIEARRLVGARLREMRNRLNYTQEAVATDLCIAHSTICSYENGNRAISIDRLADFAAYFGMELSELVSPPPRGKARSEVSRFR